MQNEKEEELHGLLNGHFKYKRDPNGAIDKTKVICVVCGKEFAYHRSSSSLKYHLNSKHVLASTAVTSPPAATVSNLRQTTLTETSRHKLSKSTSQSLTNAISKWIAMDCRPINVVEDRGLMDAFRIASSDTTYTPPSRGTVLSRINQLYDTEKKSKRDTLAQTKHVALTGDHWTSISNHNYLGVTAHVIDCDWKLKSFALTVLKSVTRHYSDACAEQFLTVADDWGVREKVTTVGTDSARNMVAAARKLPFHHMPCAAHIVQRAITVCLSDSGFADTLTKCRKIVGHFKHSPANTEELHLQQIAQGQQREQLIQDVSTRWNSSLDMITRLLRNEEAVKTTLAQQKHKLVMLTASEWDKLPKLQNLLEPCKYVTELLGGEAYVSCSVVLPAFCHLHHVMRVSDEDPAYVARFKTAFSKDLAERQADMNGEWLKLASALDPRFKDLKCLSRGEREQVWSSLEKILQEEGFSADTPQPCEEHEPTKKKRVLLLGSDSDSEEENHHSNALHRYRAEPSIGMDECPLEWWSAHAGAHVKLSSLACKYLATPATTVPCERLFSLAGTVVQNKRASLNLENVNKLVCLSNWLKEK
ncbi:putative zinc finger BED domain-containing protein 1-like [Triplophysa rosa]|uniref:Zinc finger BED domain-containing protein 1-like n=1 Tax=Triplophysa rosa TaxID=992332 RepID=A0A9W8C542_TRIRA|nr:putative zinc finger BED domain-containing protein 1-like [Triplophysa rosa]